MNELIEAELIGKYGFVPEGLCKPVNRNRRVNKKSALVYGVGVNDADYVTNVKVELDGKQLCVWCCPAYRAWHSMMKRSYDPKYHAKNPTYTNVTVCKEWHRFSIFREWFIQQSWKGNHLDKDLLVKGNKIYSPANCLFVSAAVNNLFIDSGATRGEFPIGVSWNKQLSKFMAHIRDNGKLHYLGIFTTTEDAHQAWVSEKTELAHRLAAEQTDRRVADAILRYARELI